jgi:NADH-quinone oxidoreductase subunit A
MLTRYSVTVGNIDYFEDFFCILFFILISIIFVSIIFIITFSMVQPLSILDIQKTSTYECGFAAFIDSRLNLDVKFYKIGILFILVDIEIIILIP